MKTEKIVHLNGKAFVVCDDPARKPRFTVLANRGFGFVEVACGDDEIEVLSRARAGVP
jgi:hypothetical protein